MSQNQWVFLEEIEKVLPILSQMTGDVPRADITPLTDADMEMAKFLEKQSRNWDAGRLEELLENLRGYKEDNRVLTIKEGERYLGHVGIKQDDEDPKKGEISFISVDITVQGQGYSYLLIVEALKALKKMGCQFVKAATANEKIVGMLEKLSITPQ